MPNRDSLNIIKINIDLIDAEGAKNSDKWRANMHTVQGFDPKQETS